MTTLEDIMEWSDIPIHGVSATNKDPQRCVNNSYNTSDTTVTEVSYYAKSG